MLTKNHYFGEIALIKKCKRTATVKSINYVTCAEVNKTKFDIMMMKFPSVFKNMSEGIKKYNDKFKKFVHGALLSIDLFKEKQFPQEVIESIIYDLDYINFPEGSLLFNEGDECNQILIILSGTVDILMKYGIADIYADTVYSG